MLARRMCRSYVFSLILTGCVVIALTLFLAVEFTGLGMVPDANAASGPDTTLKSFSCYPTNEFVYDGNTGATHGDGRVLSGWFSESELDNMGLQTLPGYGQIDANFWVDVLGANTGSSDGYMAGALIVKIKWADSKLGVTTFESGCVAEIGTESQIDAKMGALEAEFEGFVDNFPGITGKKPAVASIKVKQDSDRPSRYVFSFGLELGRTCFEGADPDGDIEIGGIQVNRLTTTNFHIDNTYAGRWAFPTSYGPGNCPGAD